MMKSLRLLFICFCLSVQFYAMAFDPKTATVAESLGGSYYHEELEAVIPYSPEAVREEWIRCKNEIATRIGYIDPGPLASSIYWENSAKSTDSLLKDALIAAPFFKKMLLEIANETKTEANFGVKGKAIVKAKKSLKDKISQDMKELSIPKSLAVSKIRDAVRGTLIAETPEQISSTVEAIREHARRLDCEAVFSNLWIEERPTGYVAVHSKILFPVSKGKKSDYIVAEIQIHLRCIMDGTLQCPKEQAHLIYKNDEADCLDPQFRSGASTLIFLTGLKNLIDNEL